MSFECDVCNKKFNAVESLEQHKSMAHAIKENTKGKINFKKYIYIVGIVLIIGLISGTFYIKSQKTGVLDGFATCLSEKGVVVYGNDGCSYTIQQLNMFGKSEKYLDYKQCIIEDELCDEKGVEITPTWEIEGNTYSGIHTIEKLSELSGCVLE
ncbi:MAG: hypothetical protein KKF56_02080 [Nanoarchaeota archaeon]|nr:hypothetical protein [Nanoarchaeota archaeon]